MCHPGETDVSRTAQCGVGDVDGQCDAGCCAYAKGKPLHGAQQNQFCEVGDKGVSDGRHYHQDSSKHTDVLTLVCIYQIGMERTDSKHGHRKDQKHAARLPDGNTQLLSHHKRKQREKHIDGYEQQQICRTHPPKIECHEFVSTVLSHSGNLNSSHRIHNG